MSHSFDMDHTASPRTSAVPWIDAALAVLVACALAGTLLSVATAGAALTAVLVQGAFIAPGMLMVAHMLPAGGRWLGAWTVGPFVGLGASNLALMALWAVGARGGWLMAAAPAIAMLLVWPAARLRDRWRFVAPHPSDLRMLLLALLLVPLLAGWPLANVGAERPEGRVYRQYFTADYVWGRAVVAELAKGDFLPVNPYYTGDVLHYYWLPHLLSAVEHRTWPDVDLDALLLTRTVLVDAMLVALLYGIARLAVPQPWGALAGVTCGFVATSFEGLVEFWVLTGHEPLSS